MNHSVREKLKMLIVEDDQSLRDLYDITLPCEIFEKRMVNDGKSAINNYHSWHPDIIILDLLLPKMLGYSVLKEVRQTSGDKVTTIVVSSSVDSEEDIMFCQELSVQGYIVKPFDRKKLLHDVLSYHNQKSV